MRQNYNEKGKINCAVCTLNVFLKVQLRLKIGQFHSTDEQNYLDYIIAL